MPVLSGFATESLAGSYAKSGAMVNRNWDNRFCRWSRQVMARLSPSCYDVIEEIGQTRATVRSSRSGLSE